MNSILGYIIQGIFIIILINTTNISSLNNENSDFRLRSILHNDSNLTQLQPSKTTGKPVSSSGYSTEWKDHTIDISVGVWTILIATVIVALFKIFWKLKQERNEHDTVFEWFRHHYKQKFKYLSFVEGNTFESYGFDEMYVGEAELKFVPPNNNRQKSKSESGEQDTTTDKLESLLGSRGKRVIIEGAPGSGKTTLTKWICRQWAMKSSFTKYKMIMWICWQWAMKSSFTKDKMIKWICRLWAMKSSFTKYKMVLRLPLKECTSDDVKSLSDAIKTCFPDQETKLEIILKFVTRPSNQNDILIIFDGYDKICNRKSTYWYDEIICGNNKDYDGCQILITTRVGFLNNRDPGFEILKETPRFKLEFDRNNNMSKFVQKYFKESTTSQSQVEQLLADNVSLCELCTCPLFLGMICFLVKDSLEGTISTLQSKYISLTTIYSSFINKLLTKHLQYKSNKLFETEFEHEFMNKKKPNVGIVAVFLLRNGNDTFTLGDLQKEFKEQYNQSEYKSLCEKLEKLGILMKTDSSYKFFHSSVVEFLSAWHVVRNISEFISNSKITFTIGVNTRCFIVGLISSLSSLDIKLNDVELRGIVYDALRDIDDLYAMIYETLSNEDLFIQCCNAIDELCQHLEKIESLANDSYPHITIPRKELVERFQTIVQHDTELNRKCVEFKTLLDEELLETSSDFTSSVINIIYGVNNFNSLKILFNFPIFNSNTSVIAFCKLWHQLLSWKTNTFLRYHFNSENITADSFSELGNIIELSSRGTSHSLNLTSTCGRDTCTTSISLYFQKEKKTDEKAVTLLFGSKPSIRCLKEFILTEYELKDSEEVKCLVKYLPMEALTKLRLQYCGNLLLKNTRGDHVSFVKELHESLNIEDLTLSNNSFGPDDMGSLSTALQNKPNLLVLNLSDNQLSLINDADVELFTSALNGMGNLTHLFLNNSFGSDSFGYDNIGSLFRIALQNKINLQKLDLGDNQLNSVNDADAKSFARALNEMSELTHLHLSNCRLTDEGGIVLCLSREILDGQLSLPSISRIHLENNLINKEAVVLVRAVLQLNETRGVWLCLEGNPIDNKTLEDMAKIVTETLSQEECSGIASSGLPAYGLNTESELWGKSNQYQFMHYLFAPMYNTIEPNTVTFGVWSENMKNACQKMEMERQPIRESMV